MTSLRVLVQVGHANPREPGFEAATGAVGELAVVRKVGRALVSRLQADSRFEPRLIPGRVPSDVKDGSWKVNAFLALHCDGATSREAEGYSFGYPPGSRANKRLANLIGGEFEKFHRSERRGDNNTADMAEYYGWKRVPTGGPEVLVEHGFVSNPEERAWLHAHIDELAAAEYRALLAHFRLHESEPEAVSPRTSLLAPARTTQRQVGRYLLSKPHGVYSDRQVRNIGRLYFETAQPVGLDPLLAVAQMVLETGNLTSEWSQPPHRNPAGIGVTGEPGAGVSFPSWKKAVEAHVGRLAAYAVSRGEETELQRRVIEQALRWRALPDRFRGVAPTLAGLTGRWATDRGYARKICRVANEIRRGT
jgi:Mannosyl-glycoprotein endo-beta-N-acetylglucosaminidase/N-acetylmuramoyl-L-alanine amidase